MSFIYVIAADDILASKIGIAGDPKRRLCDMQVGSPVRLDLIWTMRADDAFEARKIESEAHKILSRYSTLGEWFQVESADCVEAVCEAAYRISLRKQATATLLDALNNAISISGSQISLASSLTVLTGEKVSQQRIAHWVKVGKVSATFAIPLEKVTGVPRYELRPDLYPPGEYAA